MLIFKIKGATSSSASWSYFSFKTYFLPTQKGGKKERNTPSKNTFSFAIIVKRHFSSFFNLREGGLEKMLWFVLSFYICQQSLRAVEKKRPRTERRRMEHDGKCVEMQTLDETTWRYLSAIPT
jgi:hypothetical protein